MPELENRVTALEKWRHEKDTSAAVDAERRKHMDKRFDDIDTGMKRLDGHFSKIVWIMVASIIGALMTFVIKGGLNVGS